MNSKKIARTDHRNKKVYTISFGRANFFTFFFMFFVFVIFVLCYESIWNVSVNFDLIKSSFLFVFVLGIVAHELLHGCTWSLYTKRGLKSIRFGFKWKSLTPYCHCKESLKVKYYRLGIIMPLIILGVLPCIYSIIVGRGVIFFYSVVFICVAAGDILVLLMLRKFGNEEYVRDHPTKMGFSVEERSTKTDL